MTKFVYVTNEYRDAWKNYLTLRDDDNALSDYMGWQRFSDTFIEEFNYKLSAKRAGQYLPWTALHLVLHFHWGL